MAKSVPFSSINNYFASNILWWFVRSSQVFKQIVNLYSTFKNDSFVLDKVGQPVFLTNQAKESLFTAWTAKSQPCRLASLVPGYYYAVSACSLLLHHLLLRASVEASPLLLPCASAMLHCSTLLAHWPKTPRFLKTRPDHPFIPKLVIVTLYSFAGLNLHDKSFGL